MDLLAPYTGVDDLIPKGYIDKRLLTGVTTTDSTKNNSSSFTEEAALTFALEAATHYAIEGHLFISGYSNDDLKCNFTLPGGSSTCFFGVIGNLTTTTGTTGGADWKECQAHTTAVDALIGPSSSAATSGTINPLHALVIGTVYCDTAGDFKFKWAQNVAAARDSKLLKGSNFTLTKIG